MLSVLAYGQHLYPISTTSGCGFIDNQGEIVVPQNYLECI